MTFMRARKLKQAGWMIFGTFLIAGSAKAEPALPPPVGTQVYGPHPGVMPPGAPPAEPDSDSTFDNLDIVDAGLKGKLAVLRVGSEPSANDLLSVFAGFKNKTPHALTIEVETIYQDASGNALNAGSWVRLVLGPHEEKEYRSTSISEQFDSSSMSPHFLIRVRRMTGSGATH